MGKIIQTIFGGGSKPKVSTVAQETVTEDKKKAKKSRAQVLSTAGGVAGQELQAGQVQGKDTLFGN